MIDILSSGIWGRSRSTGVTDGLAADQSLAELENGSAYAYHTLFGGLTMGRVQQRACWPISAQVSTNSVVVVGTVGADAC